MSEGHFAEMELSIRDRRQHHVSVITNVYALIINPVRAPIYLSQYTNDYSAFLAKSA
ncbi:hypothetical protein [Croceicoccus naphthovorans]|uniref:hypothetical protein n=1 Tax=Croceicoccus naphthovorans TaxID=1348774 RepID=UPI000A41F9D6|nr:hypothetical protein [Croceicoccus naphthovorans]